MFEFISHLTSNAIGIFLVDYLLTDFSFRGSYGDLLLISFIFSLIQFFLKPILKVITFPLIIVTLGLFNIFINIFLLWILSLIVPPNILMISGFWTFAFAAILISFVNIFLNHYFKKYY